jgi:hypothetical protein
MKITDQMLTKELQTAEREREMFMYTNNMKKVQLINELKNGLGNEIKELGGKITIIKRPWYYKLKMFLKKLFTRF